ncbi:hypothetical protein BUALT_Bualt07G0024800 [Buddleja alternifolia]|uniref:Uncharacterized protein n=1 Tax=Buddleja alternifolia TaxID=168488 RepID=A0AAV6XE27_9LAMI|nr:hypothetical protein BUALT_Bualt07G0024800 [Buddleja alternifolia]
MVILSFHNLAHLSKLESLFFDARRISFLEMAAFPHSLKKLELSSCEIGPETWNPIEGEFLRLKLLSMKFHDLVCWRAEDVHFPCLETLVPEQIHDLKEIPSDYERLKCDELDS